MVLLPSRAGATENSADSLGRMLSSNSVANASACAWVTAVRPVLLRQSPAGKLVSCWTQTSMWSPTAWRTYGKKV